MKTLKLYFKKKLLSTRLVSYAPLLYPKLGPVFKETTPFLNVVFQKWNYDSNYYRINSNLKECDYILVSNDFWMLQKYDPLKLKYLINLSEKTKIPLLIDASGDNDKIIPIKNCVVMRTSQYRSKLQVNEIIIPAYVEDLLESYFKGIICCRKKQETPSIGFVGWGVPGPATTPKTWLKSQLLKYTKQFIPLNARTEGLILRSRILRSLENEKGVKTNFILRDAFGGRTNSIKGNISKIREEFVQNIAGNDYTVCVRGGGNYSHRFYEALSLGRIPLILDTDIILPLEEKINYRDFCLFVEIREIDKIGRILTDFHHHLSPEEFIRKQNSARDAFANYLRVDKFTRYLVAEIKNKQRKL